MAILDPARKASSMDVDVDVERFEREDVDNSEEARFLPADAPATPGASENVPSKSTQRYVVVMCVQFLFMIEFSQYIMEPPLQMIMEDFICYKQYPDHRMGLADMKDTRCKGSDIQGTLAMARSWLMFANMLVPLLVQVPFGIMADNHGRRPVLFMSLLGIVFAVIWHVIVLRHPDTFSIYHLLFSSIPLLVGGGGSVVSAMVWTILTDAVPAEKRTSIFYLLHAMMLVLSAVFRPIAGWLMSMNPWLPMWLGLGALILSWLSTLLIPETLHFRKLDPNARSQEEEERRRQSMDDKPSWTKQTPLEKAWSNVMNDLSKTWGFMLGLMHLWHIIASYCLCFPIYVAFEMNLLQYVTKRFGWDWSTAAYFTTISKVTSVVVLLGLLPLASMFLTKRYGLCTLSRDLYLSRVSVLFLVAGNVLAAVAATPWLLVVALVILSCGNGFWPQVRAILSGVVEQENLATMNTIIATAETLAGLVTVPTLGWLLSKGIELEGVWMGLPYVMTSIWVILAAVLMFKFRLPQGVEPVDGRYELLDRHTD